MIDPTLLSPSRFSLRLLNCLSSAEAESSGVSLLMMGYISNELKTPVKAITNYLESAVNSIQAHADREVKHDFVLDGMRADCQTAIDSIQDTTVCLSLLETIVSDVSNMQSMQLGRISVNAEQVDVVQVLRQVPLFFPLSSSLSLTCGSCFL